MPSVFLSPSLQPFNEYVGGGNEQYYMNLIADAMEPYLQTNGITYGRNQIGTSLGQSIRDSNSGTYDLHLAIHSNASPPSMAGVLQGTDVYYRSGSAEGQRAANIIAENFKRIYPDPSKVDALSTTALVELNRTKAPAVLIETAYHDNPEDADWIRNNINRIAENLVQSLTIYFDIPFISPPVEARYGIVKTSSGNLNIRQKPEITAPVIYRAPSGSSVLILGRWDNWYVVNAAGNVGYARSDYIIPQS